MIESSQLIYLEPILIVCQFSIPLLGALCSESMGVWNFEILVEDSNTGSVSSVIVREKYLFTFQSWQCALCIKNQLGGGRKYYYGLNFCFLRVI